MPAAMPGPTPPRRKPPPLKRWPPPGPPRKAGPPPPGRPAKWGAPCGAPPRGGAAKLAEGIAIGRASARTAAVLNTLKLVIIGSCTGYLAVTGYLPTILEGGRSRASHRLCAGKDT